MPATVNVEKKLNKEKLCFINKYYAEQFIAFCLLYSNIQPDINHNVYILTRRWVEEVCKVPAGANLEIDPLSISIMTATVNDNISAFQEKLRPQYSSHREGIVFCMNVTPIKSFRGLLSGIGHSAAPLFGS